jgi:hypothetical protein
VDRPVPGGLARGGGVHHLTTNVVDSAQTVALREVAARAFNAPREHARQMTLNAATELCMKQNVAFVDVDGQYQKPPASRDFGPGKPVNCPSSGAAR